MHGLMNQPAKGRLQRSSFMPYITILERIDPEQLYNMPTRIPSVKTAPSWKRGQLPRICVKVPGVEDRGCQPGPERKSLMQEYANVKYPKGQRPHAYTDGSATKLPEMGGGVYIRYNDGEAHITIATEKYSSNFKADMKLSKKQQLRSETTYSGPSPIWSSSQMLSQSSANSKIPARKISKKWKHPGRPYRPAKPAPAVDSCPVLDPRI